MNPLRGAVCLAALALFFAAGPCLGQVKVSLDVDHDSALRFEEVPLTLTIRNDTDGIFWLDQSHPARSGALAFVVETVRGRIVPGRRARPPVPYLVLEPGESRDVKVDLSLYCDLSQAGRYLVRAVVKDNSGNETVSQADVVDVVNGIELVKQTVDVPGAPGQRWEYSLRYWSRNKRERLFLSVDDSRNHINYGVFDLGPLMRVVKPRLVMRRDGTSTVIHQRAQGLYVRTNFTTSYRGVVMEGQTSHNADGSPYVFPSDEKEADIPPPGPE